MTAKAISISTNDRQRVAQGLGVVLADTYTLYLTTHGYHWNVTGPMFPALHALFETQYNDLWVAADVVAERIRSLDHPAPFGCTTFTKQATVHEGHAVQAVEMISDLIQGHEAVARTIRQSWILAEKADDQATLDLLAQRLAAHEKAAWMLRATSMGPAASHRGARPRTQK